MNKCKECVKKDIEIDIIAEYAARYGICPEDEIKDVVCFNCSQSFKKRWHCWEKFAKQKREDFLK